MRSGLKQTVSLGRMAKAAGKYLRNHIHVCNKRELILRAYDTIIAHINNGQSEEAREVLYMLIKALDFSAEPSSAIGLMRLYRYCEAALARNDLVEASRIITNLRNAWAMADIPQDVVKPDF